MPGGPPPIHIGGMVRGGSAQELRRKDVKSPHKEAGQKKRASSSNLYASTGNFESSAIARVAAFAAAGRASLSPQSMSVLRKTSDSEDSMRATRQGMHSGGIFWRTAPKPSQARSARAREGSSEEDSRPKSSMLSARPDLSGLELPPRARSAMGMLSGLPGTHQPLPATEAVSSSAPQDPVDDYDDSDDRSSVEVKVKRKVFKKKEDPHVKAVKDLEQYAQYMEECTNMLEERLQMHIPPNLQQALAEHKRRGAEAARRQLEEENKPTARKSSDRRSAAAERLDDKLNKFLDNHKRVTSMPKMAVRIQKWWRMTKRWRNYRRFRKSVKVFKQRSLMLCIKSWRLTAMADAFFREGLSIKIISEWRVLARNSMIWDEESALIFLECTRLGGIPQRALFLEVNDQNTFRRAGQEHNFGKGYKHGRPLPTREHVIVVQSIRRTMIRMAKLRLRRWAKWVLWKKHQSERGSEKLALVYQHRREEKFCLKFLMWSRYTVVRKCMRTKEEVPEFEPQDAFWDDWFLKHTRKQQLDSDHVLKLQWRFLTRNTIIRWTRYQSIEQTKRYVIDKTVTFYIRKARREAFAEWAELAKSSKAIRYRYHVILSNLSYYASRKAGHRAATNKVVSLWQERVKRTTIGELRRIAHYMLVIHAGGLHRLRQEHSRALWAAFAWLSWKKKDADAETEAARNLFEGSTLMDKDRLPGGLCCLGVCDAHFHFSDSFRLWASKARRRKATRTMVMSLFYDEYVAGILQPVFGAWKEMVGKGKAEVELMSKEDASKQWASFWVDKERIAKVANRNRRVTGRGRKHHPLANLIDADTLFPRLVTMMVKKARADVERQELISSLQNMSKRDRVEQRQRELSTELGATGQHATSRIPAVRAFANQERQRQTLLGKDRLAGLKRDYKLLLAGELYDLIAAYSGEYDRCYRGKGKSALPFTTQHDRGAELFARTGRRGSWFEEGQHGAAALPRDHGRGRRSSILHQEREVPAGGGEVLGGLWFPGGAPPAEEGAGRQRRLSLAESVASAAGEEGNQEAEQEEVQESEEEQKAIAQSMWEYEDKMDEDPAELTVQQRVERSLQAALSDMYGKMLAAASTKMPIGRRDFGELPSDPYFDEDYLVRRDQLMEDYQWLREDTLGPDNTQPLLKLPQELLEERKKREAELAEQAEEAEGDGKSVSPEKSDELESFESNIIEASFYGIDIRMDLEAESPSMLRAGADGVPRSRPISAYSEDRPLIYGWRGEVLKASQSKRPPPRRKARGQANKMYSEVLAAYAKKKKEREEEEEEQEAAAGGDSASGRTATADLEHGLSESPESRPSTRGGLSDFSDVYSRPSTAGAWSVAGDDAKSRRSSIKGAASSASHVLAEDMVREPSSAAELAQREAASAQASRRGSAAERAPSAAGTDGQGPDGASLRGASADRTLSDENASRVSSLASRRPSKNSRMGDGAEARKGTAADVEQMTLEEQRRSDMMSRARSATTSGGRGGSDTVDGSSRRPSVSSEARSEAGEPAPGEAPQRTPSSTAAQLLESVGSWTQQLGSGIAGGKRYTRSRPGSSVTLKVPASIQEPQSFEEMEDSVQDDAAEGHVEEEQEAHVPAVDDRAELEQSLEEEQRLPIDVVDDESEVGVMMTSQLRVDKVDNRGSRPPSSSDHSHSHSHSDAEVSAVDELHRPTSSTASQGVMEEAQTRRSSTSGTASRPATVDVSVRRSSVTSQVDGSEATEEVRGPWDDMMDAHSWVKAETRDIKEALRGGMDSLYWRSKVTAKRSRRQKLAQIEIDKEYELSRQRHQAKMDKLYEVLGAQDLSSLQAVLPEHWEQQQPPDMQVVDPAVPKRASSSHSNHRPLFQSAAPAPPHPLAGKARGCLAAKSRKLGAPPRLNPVRQQPSEDLEEREFVQIATATPILHGKLPLPPRSAPSTSMEWEASLSQPSWTEPAAPQPQPGRSLADWMLAPTASMPPKEPGSVPALPFASPPFHTREPRRTESTDSLYSSTVRQHADRVLSSTSGLRLPSKNRVATTSVAVRFPSSGSAFVAGGAKAMRPAGAWKDGSERPGTSGSQSARTRPKLGKLAVVRNPRPKTDRSERPVGDLLVAGGRYAQAVAPEPSFISGGTDSLFSLEGVQMETRDDELVGKPSESTAGSEANAAEWQETGVDQQPSIESTGKASTGKTSTGKTSSAGEGEHAEQPMTVDVMVEQTETNAEGDEEEKEEGKDEGYVPAQRWEPMGQEVESTEAVAPQKSEVERKDSEEMAEGEEEDQFPAPEEEVPESLPVELREYRVAEVDEGTLWRPWSHRPASEILQELYADHSAGGDEHIETHWAELNRASSAESSDGSAASRAAQRRLSSAALITKDGMDESDLSLLDPALLNFDYTPSAEMARSATRRRSVVSSPKDGVSSPSSRGNTPPSGSPSPPYRSRKSSRTGSPLSRGGSPTYRGSPVHPGDKRFGVLESEKKYLAVGPKAGLEPGSQEHDSPAAVEQGDGDAAADTPAGVSVFKNVADAEEASQAAAPKSEEAVVDASQPAETEGADAGDAAQRAVAALVDESGRLVTPGSRPPSGKAQQGVKGLGVAGEQLKGSPSARRHSAPRVARETEASKEKLKKIQDEARGRWAGVVALRDEEGPAADKPAAQGPYLTVQSFANLPPKPVARGVRSGSFTEAADGRHMTVNPARARVRGGSLEPDAAGRMVGASPLAVVAPGGRSLPPSRERSRTRGPTLSAGSVRRSQSPKQPWWQRQATSAQQAPGLQDDKALAVDKERQAEQLASATAAQDDVQLEQQLREGGVETEDGAFAQAEDGRRSPLQDGLEGRGMGEDGVFLDAEQRGDGWDDRGEDDRDHELLSAAAASMLEQMEASAERGRTQSGSGGEQMARTDSTAESTLRRDDSIQQLGELLAKAGRDRSAAPSPETRPGDQHAHEFSAYVNKLQHTDSMDQFDKRGRKLPKFRPIDAPGSRPHSRGGSPIRGGTPEEDGGASESPLFRHDEGEEPAAELGPHLGGEHAASALNSPRDGASRVGSPKSSVGGGGLEAQDSQQGIEAAGADGQGLRDEEESRSRRNSPPSLAVEESPREWGEIDSNIEGIEASISPHSTQPEHGAEEGRLPDMQSVDSQMLSIRNPAREFQRGGAGRRKKVELDLFKELRERREEERLRIQQQREQDGTGSPPNKPWKKVVVRRKPPLPKKTKRVDDGGYSSGRPEPASPASPSSRKDDLDSSSTSSFLSEGIPVAPAAVHSSKEQATAPDERADANAAGEGEESERESDGRESKEAEEAEQQESEEKQAEAQEEDEDEEAAAAAAEAEAEAKAKEAAAKAVQDDIPSPTPGYDRYAEFFRPIKPRPVVDPDERDGDEQAQEVDRELSYTNWEQSPWLSLTQGVDRSFEAMRMKKVIKQQVERHVKGQESSEEEEEEEEAVKNTLFTGRSVLTPSGVYDSVLSRIRAKSDAVDRLVGADYAEAGAPLGGRGLLIDSIPVVDQPRPGEVLSPLRHTQENLPASELAAGFGRFGSSARLRSSGDRKR